jgi:hypothetical protein
MDAWSKLGCPFAAGDAVEAAYGDSAPALKAWLDELSGDKNSKKKALGNLLRDYRNRVLDGRKFDRTDNKRPKWRVVRLDAREVTLTNDAKPLVDAINVPTLPDAPMEPQ